MKVLLNSKKGNIYKYRYDARFTIGTSLYKIKGYDKLIKYGFYNKETNPNGVVKDHRLSIKYGFTNKIDPLIIGHLANCEFLFYKDNIKKSAYCSISLDKLLKDIDLWN